MLDFSDSKGRAKHPVGVSEIEKTKNSKGNQEVLRRVASALAAIGGISIHPSGLEEFTYLGR